MTDLNRRTLLQIAGASAAAFGTASILATTAKAQTMTQDWDKVFPKSDRVDHQKVSFTNRYGITLSGDLYLPKDRSGALPALAVGGPFGAV